jgi:hypothetical protein
MDAESLSSVTRKAPIIAVQMMGDLVRICAAVRPDY